MNPGPYAYDRLLFDVKYNFFDYEDRVEPRPGFIDAGIVLKEGFVLSREDMVTMSTSEWQQISDWADSMRNIAVREIKEKYLLYVYDNVPCITSMEA